MERFCYICGQKIIGDVLRLSDAYVIHPECNPGKDNHKMRLRVLVETFIDITDAELEKGLADQEGFKDLLSEKTNGNHGLIQGDYLERQLIVFDKDKYYHKKDLTCETCKEKSDESCQECRSQALHINDLEW